MQEVLNYLRANGYKTYIVTGGGQDFVRVYSEQTYGIPPEQVVGTAGGTKYGYDKDGKPILTKEPKLLLNDNNAGKPEGIHLMIGRRPYAAFGNSTGDQQMLEYTKAGDGARLAMLVLHDDATREYAYGPAQGLARHQGRHLHPGALRRGEEAGLDRHQHEERLEAHLSLAESSSKAKASNVEGTVAFPRRNGRFCREQTQEVTQGIRTAVRRRDTLVVRLSPFRGPNSTKLAKICEMSARAPRTRLGNPPPIGAIRLCSRRNQARAAFRSRSRCAMDA